jgi:nicotinamide-nucleotide amidase
MIAEIITAGTELLLGHVVDTNSAYISRRLAGLGVSVFRKSTVGDNLARLCHCIQEALGRADVVLITGGLGPTEDDLAREASALALGVELEEDADTLTALERFFASRGTPMPENNRKQALRPKPEDGRLLPNDVGTAPGLLFETGGRVVICLPGVPREMERMMEQSVEPYLRDRISMREGGVVIVSRALRTIGIGESALEERILDLAHGRDNPTVATYAGSGECEVRITARAARTDEARAMIDRVAAEVRARLGALVYGEDDDTLEAVAGRLLMKAGATLATAESCTGGMVAAAITSVSGSSDYFERGYVTYSNRAKQVDLGVDADIIRQHGAVSRPTAIAMAAGASRRSGASIGVSITGIAGPTGGTADKPVGTVYLALWDATHCSVVSARIKFGGDRLGVRQRSTKLCIDMVRRHVGFHWAEEITDTDARAQARGCE